MEDSGYMANAAFMDKVMHKMACMANRLSLLLWALVAMYAILATRTIESRSSRMITMLINPLMSCSARLPIYILL